MSAPSLAYLVNWKGLKEKCSREGCRATSLRHSLAGRKAGMRLGTDWFCSPECFRDGAAARIHQLQDAAARRPAPHPSRMPLGLLLVSRGCITDSQLRVALQQQQAGGGMIGDILCELRFATETQVAAAAATQWGCPVFSAKTRPAEIQARIPAALMKLVAMAPVHYSAALNKLLVGFVHGIEHQVLRTIEEITSCVTEPCFITASECWESIRSLSGRNTEVTFERVSSAAEMANVVQSYAFQIGADEARLGLCRDYVWARLNRANCPTDLLFSLSGKNACRLEFEEN